MQFEAVSTATDADVPGVLALLRRCALLESGVAEAIYGFSVVRSAVTLVGCAGLEVYGEFGLLRSVAVRESARNAGLGKTLVDSVASNARSRGLSELFLLTTTAQAFFERRGFQVVSRARGPVEVAESWEFRAGCPQTAIAMRFALGGG
jgi:amino-acid N-acetyltransferase